jgi:hypothetical protein
LGRRLQIGVLKEFKGLIFPRAVSVQDDVTVLQFQIDQLQVCAAQVFLLMEQPYEKCDIAGFAQQHNMTWYL